MYIPSTFKPKDQAESRRLVDQYPFAVLLMHSADEILVSHLPLLLIPGSPDRLVGHLSRANSQARAFEKNPEGNAVKVIFNGPHAYVSPRWYVENDVPTWNYAVVHITGKLRLIRDLQGTLDILQALADRFEGGDEGRWAFNLPEDLREERVILGAIVAFEIEVESIEGKFKLSQNRSKEDQRRVIVGLASRGDEASRKTQELMVANQS